jgi:predicted alpha/beta superfamily hydrolase
MTRIPFSDGTGFFARHADFPSRYVQPRHVDVWHPPLQPGLRYPVIYVHDGQNLFDPAIAYGGVDWGLDEAVTRLMAQGVTSGGIIVGIWNDGPRRWREYMPQRPLEHPRGREVLAYFERELGGKPFSDDYLRFLVQELKPFVDTTYPTLMDRQHTFVMGSSMGGLISLYALTEYPDVFGAAACVSTHWPAGGEALELGLMERLPRAGRHRLYFDFGTQTLDEAYEPHQRRVDALVCQAGYAHGLDWITQKFSGAEHSERSWRERADIPLAFLLKHP